MDIQYLLLLQQLRNSAGGWLTSMMMLVSHMATVGCLVVCVVIYWGINRRLGYWLVSNCISSLFFNNVIKLTVCVYRPWIRYPQLQPYQGAIESATGYSFPSGHTQTATSFYGSIATRYGKQKKGLAAFCVAMILLTGFSRNFLGVHTPQDVLFAMALSAILVYFNTRLFEKIDRHPSFLPKFLLFGCIAAVLCILYFALKSYPMDYVNGVPIVDPAKMKNDGYMIAGACIGILTGTYLEVRYVKFETDGSILQRIIRVAMGIPVIALFLRGVKNSIYALIGPAAGHVVVFALMSFYIIFVYPALFTAVRRRLLKKNETAGD